MKLFLTAFFLISILGDGFSQEIFVLKGKVVSEEGQPVPYASIINISTRKHGTTTNEAGSFSLKTPNNLKESIKISSLGFHEVIVSLDSLLSMIDRGSIIMKTKFYQLEEFEVVNTELNSKFIGGPDDLLLDNSGEIYGYSISNVPGFSTGVYITPKKKESGRLARIYFYITKTGHPEAPFSIRVLKHSKKLKHNIMYRPNEFNDLAKEEIIVMTAKVGWNSIDIVDQNMSIDGNGFMILMTTIDNGQRYAYVDKNGKSRYGAQIGTFSNSKPKDIYHAIGMVEFYGYSNVASVRVPIPAVYVEYYAK